MKKSKQSTNLTCSLDKVAKGKAENSSSGSSSLSSTSNEKHNVFTASNNEKTGFLFKQGVEEAPENRKKDSMIPVSFQSGKNKQSNSRLGNSN